MSTVDRFSEEKPQHHQLQYSSTVGSLITESQNCKLARFPFNSGVFRREKIDEDTRSYHYPCRMEFRGPKWSQPSQKRQLFSCLNDHPGPGEYTSQKNVAKNVYSIPKETSTDPKQITKASTNIRVALGLGNLSNVALIADLRRGTKIQKKARQQPQNIKTAEKFSDAVYEVEMSWEKRSFNKLFTKDFLSGGNNPLMREF